MDAVKKYNPTTERSESLQRIQAVPRFLLFRLKSPLDF
jgi:hypothetical protein